MKLSTSCIEEDIIDASYTIINQIDAQKSSPTHRQGFFNNLENFMYSFLLIYPFAEGWHPARLFSDIHSPWLRKVQPAHHFSSTPRDIDEKTERKHPPKAIQQPPRQKTDTPDSTKNRQEKRDAACPRNRDAVQSAELYSPQSTRVLAAEYATDNRKPDILFDENEGRTDAKRPVAAPPTEQSIKAFLHKRTLGRKPTGK